MKTITKSTIMKKAWEIAKTACSKFGGSAKEYFSEALRLTWAKVKEIVSVKKVEVPDWFCKKTIGYGMGYAFRTVKVLRETEKAVLVTLAGSDVWVPKSIIK